MPATQSATYQPASITWQAGAAVDGNFSTYSYAFNSSVPAWWQVDLSYECLVYNVTVYAPENGELSDSNWKLTDT